MSDSENTEYINTLNLWQTILDLPNRLLTLVWKMLSVKGLVLAGAFFLCAKGVLTGWHAVVVYLISALIVIFGRDALEWITALKELKG